MTLKQETIQSIQRFRKHVATVKNLSNQLVSANVRLAVVKEQVAVDDLGVLKTDLAKLQAQKSRYEPENVLHCNAYSNEKAAKTATESLRTKARTSLDHYREQIFPAFEEAINRYLNFFGASYRLDGVQSVNRRTGSTTTYSVVINHQSVDVTADEGPSFRNTLSAGDRNTLALAFFFASLDKDPNLKKKIVVFDDPITSLDDHRALATRQKIIALARKVNQVIVLSHSRKLLCGLWEQTDMNTSTALRLNRTASGSETEIVAWDVRNDSISEHDKRHELVREYLRNADPSKERQVAEALRPILEAFIRVAYPEHAPPGTLLGRFIDSCKRRVGDEDEIISNVDTAELDALREYVNLFHHDTNPAWQTAEINDSELSDFAQRTLLLITIVTN